MGFKLNLTESEIKNAQGGGFKPLPEGTYGAIVFDVTEKQSKAGNDMYEIDFKITEGPEGIGRKIRGWFVVSGKALFSVVGLLKALDFPYPTKDTPAGEFEFPDGDEFLGKELNLKIKQEAYETENEDGEVVKKLALKAENVVRFTEGKQIVKVIYVPGKLVNVVIKE